MATVESIKQAERAEPSRSSAAVAVDDCATNVSLRWAQLYRDLQLYQAQVAQSRADVEWVRQRAAAVRERSRETYQRAAASEEQAEVAYQRALTARESALAAWMRAGETQWLAEQAMSAPMSASIALSDRVVWSDVAILGAPVV